MTDLLSGGLSFALLSADSSAKAAQRPMNMVSRELKKTDPDLELVERAGKYGGGEIGRAGKALDLAQEELKEAQKKAGRQKKEEMEARLEEKSAQKAAQRQAQKAAEDENVRGQAQASSENAGAGASDGRNIDADEIGSEAVSAARAVLLSDALPDLSAAGIYQADAAGPGVSENPAFRCRIDLRA